MVAIYGGKGGARRPGAEATESQCQRASLPRQAADVRYTFLIIPRSHTRPPAVSDDMKRSTEDAARGTAPAKAGPPAQARAGGDREPSFEGNKIVFFCSNDHRIEVDRAWAGKRGTCSKQGCGVPVVIPTPPGLERPTEASRPPAAPVASAAPSWDAGAGPPVTTGPETLDPEPVPEAIGWGSDIDAIDHPTARLVAVLWRERANGGIVEVHLSGGSVIMPQWYDPHWSCGTHALFAAPGPDSSITLTAVAWDQIQKVVVRQLQYVPDDMFPE